MADQAQLPLMPAGGTGAPSGPVEPSAARVRTLAGTLAGYRWPGRGGLDKLRKPQQAVVLKAAYEALRTLAEAPD